MDLHDLARLIRPDATGASVRLRQATVSAVAADGLLTLTIAGSAVQVSGVRSFASVCPKVGGSVWLATDGCDLFALGTMTPVGPAYCSVVRTQVLSVADVTDTQVSFQAAATVEADTHGMFATGTPTYLTCRTPGVYQVSANIGWAAGATGLRTMWFQAGATTITREARPGSGTGTNLMSLSCLASLAAGDQLSLWVRQSQGAALDLQAGAYYPRLSCCWLRPVKS